MRVIYLGLIQSFLIDFFGWKHLFFPFVKKINSKLNLLDAYSQVNFDLFYNTSMSCTLHEDFICVATSKQEIDSKQIGVELTVYGRHTQALLYSWCILTGLFMPNYLWWNIFLACSGKTVFECEAQHTLLKKN